MKNNLDSIVLDTKKEFGEQQISITTSTFNGDIMHGLCNMHLGDSALLIIPTDSLYKSSLPFFANAGTHMKFYFKINKVFDSSEYRIFNELELLKRKNYDDSILAQYLMKVMDVPARYESGLRVTIKERGVNRPLQNGDTIQVKYTGKLMSGFVFDSNILPKFGHVELFKFVIGKGEVIKGWDEGFKYLQRGSKATIYIPSYLAYGNKQVGNIPANSILIFDVEVMRY